MRALTFLFSRQFLHTSRFARAFDETSRLPTCRRQERAHGLKVFLLVHNALCQHLELHQSTTFCLGSGVIFV
jgi:hypothetical protein